MQLPDKLIGQTNNKLELTQTQVLLHNISVLIPAKVLKMITALI